MQTGTMRQFLSDIGIEFDAMIINEPIPVNGWEVQTVTDTGKLEWRKVLRAVKKPNARHMRVRTDDFSLDCSPDHKVFVKKSSALKGRYLTADSLRSAHEYEVMTSNGWQSVVIEELPGEIEIVDIEVEGAHSYLSNGILSHNTLYGDPTTTPGGKAIPYHSSVRLKLTGGQQIKKTINGKEAVIGISVAVKTIKNKVARPWREVEFEIHFGKGVREEEQLFDALREFCDKTSKPCVWNGKRIAVEGTGGWKTFTVSDNTTGEVEKEVKFVKSAFGEKVLNVPELKPFVDALMDACFIMSPDDKEHQTFTGVDESSATELEALAIEQSEVASA